jgi:hypothetical protein
MKGELKSTGRIAKWDLPRKNSKDTKRMRNGKYRMGNAEVCHLQFSLLTPVSRFQFAVSRLPFAVCRFRT